eukprot:5766437-Amphidinium_carterae.1
MQSLIKCARCGKKPGVKSNAERSAWSAVNNAPMNEGGGPRYDNDDGRANSVFTSGLRSTGANESNKEAQQRSKGTTMRGPERFFYDKTTYTGTHTQGGPDHVPKGNGSHNDETWKRPTSGGNPTLLTAGSTAADKLSNPPSRPTSDEKRAASKGRASNTLAHAGLTGTMGSARLASKAAEARSASREGSRPLRGPERFFYDKNTYTGTHANGGPSSVAKGGGTGID